MAQLSRARRETARGLAIAALVAAEQGERANVALPAMLDGSGLSTEDKRFATELTYGCLRMCRACDWLIGQFARGELEPAVRAAARAGAYQLAFMRVPAYAAVSATVAEAPERARSLVNAVLRRVATLVDAGVRWPDPGTRLSYPDWLVRLLAEDLGRERALAAMETMNRAATVSVRPDGYTQDPASQDVGRYLAGLLAGAPSRPASAPAVAGAGPGPGRGPEAAVFDMCAAPGGKATYLAGCGHPVVAGDVNLGRALQVVANAGRLDLARVPVVVADGLAPPFRPGAFGAVLVDAPCSGLGVLRRRPDARWRLRPGDIPRLAVLQRRLLEQASGLVAPGGLLVYSVCTLSRRETVEVAEGMGAHLGAGPSGPEWEWLAVPGAPWEGVGHGALLLPQTAGTDGMYLAGWRRAADAPARATPTGGAGVGR
jgi:16S rRNA (cytosine967-C5)-methyltransferase